MHMADALLSPAVGGTMWAVSAGAIACCSVKVGREIEDGRIPLMGVLGAFVFAAQMINFSIPGTGSSGHLGGGLLLSILLGPAPAFLTIASVLVVQALFFADGGLLALGCNIFNVGFLPAFLVFPLLYRTLAGGNPGKRRLHFATVLSAVAALQLGSLAVVLETSCSNISSLPVSTFLMLMQPIHLAIGVVEGLVTVAVISFVRQARPEMLQGVQAQGMSQGRKVIFALLVAAFVTAGVLSSYASKAPDGLEWSITRITGKGDLKTPEHGPHRALADLQEKISVFAGYRFLPSGASEMGTPARTADGTDGNGAAGIVGAILTLVLIFLSGFVLKSWKKRSSQ
jgi:cobalt/nickel transport system permease protein